MSGFSEEAMVTKGKEGGIDRNPNTKREVRKQRKKRGRRKDIYACKTPRESLMTRRRKLCVLLRITKDRRIKIIGGR